jgi:hypothetical protein
MDPIEKILSELIPARSSGGLDLAMDQIFRRAEAKTWRRGIVRSISTACVFLIAGAGIGYEWGKAARPQEGSASTLQTVHTEAPAARPKPVFDFTLTATWLRESPQPQVVAVPASAAGNGDA